MEVISGSLTDRFRLGLKPQPLRNLAASLQKDMAWNSIFHRPITLKMTALTGENATRVIRVVDAKFFFCNAPTVHGTGSVISVTLPKNASNVRRNEPRKNVLVRDAISAEIQPRTNWMVAQYALNALRTMKSTPANCATV
jgi:hypothetical protein